MSKAAGRSQTRYVCQACGEAFLRWEGQCRACSAWNSLVETRIRAEPRAPRAVGPGRNGEDGPGSQPARLADVVEPERIRVPIGIGELDRVLGGGLVPGSVVLLGGANGHLKGNRHIAVENREPTANLLLTFADMANVDLQQIGHSTGRLLL